MPCFTRHYRRLAEPDNSADFVEFSRAVRMKWFVSPDDYQRYAAETAENFQRVAREPKMNAHRDEEIAMIPESAHAYRRQRSPAQRRDKPFLRWHTDHGRRPSIYGERNSARDASAQRDRYILGRGQDTNRERNWNCSWTSRAARRPNPPSVVGRRPSPAITFSRRVFRTASRISERFDDAEATIQ